MELYEVYTRFMTVVYFSNLRFHTGYKGSIRSSSRLAFLTWGFLRFAYGFHKAL